MDHKKIKLAVATPDGEMPKVSRTSFFEMAGNLRRVFHKDSRFFRQEGGPYILQNRTILLDAVREQNKKKKFDYLLWIDADQVFTMRQVSQIVELAKEKKLDAVSGLYLNKGDPFAMVCRIINPQGDMLWLREKEYKGKELLEIDAAGFGFFLLDMRAVEKYLEKFARHEWFNWFWHGPAKTWFSGEDIGFCRQFKGMGFKIHFAPQIIVGHYGKVVPADFKTIEARDRWAEVYVL